MEWTEKKIQLLIGSIKVVLIILAILGGVFFFLAITTRGIWQILLTMIFLGIPAVLFLGGLKTISEQERWDIEVFGKFYTVLSPGLKWLCPVLMKVRAIVPIWEQPVELFVEKPWIDFKGGGKAQLIEPHTWVRAKGAVRRKEETIANSVYKMIYLVQNWRVAVRENVETCLRSYLNNLTVDEAMEQIYVKKTPWWELLKGQFPDLQRKISSWGLDVTRITISDFNWSDEVEKIRDAIYREEREVIKKTFTVQAAEKEAIASAQEIGGVISQIKKILIEQKYSKEEATELAPKVFNFVKAAETGSLFLTSLREEELGPLIASAVATIEKTKEKMKEKAK